MPVVRVPVTRSTSSPTISAGRSAPAAAMASGIDSNRARASSKATQRVGAPVRQGGHSNLDLSALVPVLMVGQVAPSVLIAELETSSLGLCRVVCTYRMHTALGLPPPR